MQRTHNYSSSLAPCKVGASEVPQFVSRIFTDILGRQFRLTFLVTIVDGEMKGRLVSAEPISVHKPLQIISSQTSDYQPLCLPILYSQSKPNTEYIPDFIPVISPYFSLDFLINSQPTRAPSYAPRKFGASEGQALL